MTAQCTPMQWHMSKSINPFRASLCLDSSYVVLELEVKKTYDLNTTTMFHSNEYVEVNDDDDNNDDDDDTIVLMMMLIVIVSPMM